MGRSFGEGTGGKISTKIMRQDKDMSCEQRNNRSAEKDISVQGIRGVLGGDCRGIVRSCGAWGEMGCIVLLQTGCSAGAKREE